MVLEDIRSLPRMSAIPVEKYAEENGWADLFVQDLVRNRNKELKANQLRRFFHKIKQIQHQVETTNSFKYAQVASVMPVLAYARGRELIPEEFYELMKLCFGSERCREAADFLAAANFLEAVMAYHKYRTGK
jgi:CRISPR-associated protein Csm2